MSEKVLFGGDSVFPGVKVVNREDGLTELRSPSGMVTTMGRFVRVDTPQAQEAAGVLSERLTIRLTPEESARVREQAEAYGLSPSAYVRLVVSAQS